jgi:hypothetical protein
VKSVYVESAEIEEQDGGRVETPWLSHTMTFNQDGSIIESINRNPDGSTWCTLNEYSDAGQLIATRNYDSADQLSGQVLYTYDSEERLMAEQSISRDGGVTTPVIYEYDNEARKTKTEILHFPEDANVWIGIEGTNISISAQQAKRVETLYDQQDEAVEVRVFDADGILASRVVIRRDARGNPLEETQYTGDSVPFTQCSSDSCSVEGEAPLTEEQRAEAAVELARMFPPGTGMSNHIHNYDEEGRLIESKLTMMEMPVNHQIFKYDEAGNKSEELMYDENEALRSRVIFTREYDEHGNWTTEVVSTVSAGDAEVGLSTPCNLTRRRIIYF